MKKWTRAWLLSSLLATNACLMPSPPDLDDPERSRPYVHYLNVDPPLGEPIQVNLASTETKEYPILIPFQSEDLGEDIAGRLHLYRPDNSVRLEDTSARVPAGEFDDIRNVRMTWDATERGAGCYRLTATVAHASSFGDKGLVPEENLGDAEAVSWIANVFEPGNDNTLSECPRVGGVD